MKKYTSKTDKVAMYSKKYNMKEEDVYRILTEHEDVLTLDELKIKYDNPNIGKLPEWLSEEELSNMIWNTIHHYWSQIFEQRMSKEELFSEHQEYIRKKIGLYENHHHIKAALVKRMMTLANEYTRKGKYYLGSTDEVFDSDNQGAVRYKYEIPVSQDTEIENSMLLNKIRGVKNKEVRNLLILTGYLICNIDDLRKDYLELLRSYDKDIQHNIKELEAVVLRNDQIDRDRIDQIKVKEKRKNLKITDLIKATKFNETVGAGVNESLEEFKCYLLVTGIV